MNKDIGKLTCPECRHVQKMEIPQSSCQAFYKCLGCKKMIKAEKSCCVFCDFGDKACPIADKHSR